MNPQVLKQANPRNKTETPWLGLISLFLPLVFTGIILWAYQLTGLPGWGWRYLLPLFVLVFWIVYRAIQFTRDSLGLSSLRDGLNRFLYLFLQIGYPKVNVQMGGFVEDNTFSKALQLLGGPVKLVISPENAVLLESLYGELRVLGSGEYIVQPFEKVKQIVDLREKSQRISQRTIMTRDGIPILVKDVHFRFRPYTGVRSTKGNQAIGITLSYSEDAIIHLIYNRSFDENGIASWENTVERVVMSVITGYMSQHSASELIAPNLYGIDPRKEIYEQLGSARTHNRLMKVGAELTWIDVGTFSWPDLMRQKTESWSKKWVPDITILNEYGNSQMSVYQDLGRCEAQAEIVMSIVHSLEGVNTPNVEREELRTLMLDRISQVIENYHKDLFAEK